MNEKIDMMKEAIEGINENILISQKVIDETKVDIKNSVDDELTDLLFENIQVNAQLQSVFMVLHGVLEYSLNLCEKDNWEDFDNEIAILDLVIDDLEDTIFELIKYQALLSFTIQQKQKEIDEEMEAN